MSREPMDEGAVVEGLRGALALQQRSVAQFTIASASLFGLSYQSVEETHTHEHLIMRKQAQVDYLLRARRSS